MAINLDVFLQVLLILLLFANVRILLMNHESALCPIHHIQRQSSRKVISKELPAKCESVLGALDPLEGLVLGRNRKALLTLGVAVWDDHIQFIEPVLSSLISHVTHDDLNDITIVISINRNYISTLSPLLKSPKFSAHLKSGLLQLVSPSDDFIKTFTKYQPLGDYYLKEFSRSYSDKIISFNKNLGFLLFYASRFSDYTLHLSDESLSTRRILPDIKHYIKRYKNTTFFALTFSELKLMPSNIIYDISDFYGMFGQRSSPYLLADFRSACPSQNTIIETESDIFTLSAAVKCARPKASLRSSLTAIDKNKYSIKNVYSLDGDGAFWTDAPNKDDYIQITFDEEHRLSRVLIESGTPFLEDIPKASLKACSVNQNKTNCNLDHCQDIANLGDPVQDLSGLDKVIDFKVKCLRLEFKENPERKWMMIRDIAVWTV